MGIPGADDIMLAYQSTSFHDALYLREVLGLRPAPEFEEWLQRQGIFNDNNALADERKTVLLLNRLADFTGS
jgi:ethanolamine ammonia-lyase large subunit